MAVSLEAPPPAAGAGGQRRFQRASGVTRSLLQQVVDQAALPAGVPVLGNVDVGHTHPLATVPVGGTAQVSVGDAGCSLRLTRH